MTRSSCVAMALPITVSGVERAVDTGRDGMIWDNLRQHADTLRGRHLAELFAEEPLRFQSLHRQVGPLLFDFSKQRLTTQTLTLLADFAEARDLRGWIDRLFAGEKVNGTEDRAAMHWALRARAGGHIPEPAPGLFADVAEQLERMERIVTKLHAGQWRGVTGEVITDVVNIGVGGSDLGPLMVSRALEDCQVSTAQPLKLHFVSSMDGSQLAHLLRMLRPHNTLFIVSSKSFTTVDTLYNANTARSWLRNALGRDPAVVDCHFLGVSASDKKMAEWGIHEDNRLRLWEWVGGRFSVWSAIGLPVALTIGMGAFRDFLAGGHFMDTHFRNAPWLDNVPVLMALTGLWNTNLLSISAQAILPYDARLKYLPSYLEQLEMESNGKSVTRDGEQVDYATSPVIWGEVGPNAQHAFYQLLHQGTQVVTCDFIVPAMRYHETDRAQVTGTLTGQHELALANCLAQSRLLALGEAALPQREQMPFYKRYKGNQPSSTIMLDELTPFGLGTLLAAYEHKVFTQAVLWQINPFDQWGVELGKKIALDTLSLIHLREDSDDISDQLLATQSAGLRDSMDASTVGLIDFIKQQRRGF